MRFLAISTNCSKSWWGDFEQLNTSHKKAQSAARCVSNIQPVMEYCMSLRRFTRLTNGHSKSLRHHTAMQALFIAWYNFGRKHEALKGNTAAMASGLSDHVWTIKELIERAGKASASCE
jgi:hypothetical protein